MLVLGLPATLGVCPPVVAQSTHPPVTKVPAGTVIGDTAPDGWTHVLLVAKPRVTDGDVDAISDTVAKYASLWKFVILARTSPETGGENGGGRAEDRWQLDDVAVGLAAERQGRLVVASGPPHPDAEPPELGLIQRQLLSAAEASLDDMRIIARRTTLAIFDSSGVVRQQQQNRERIVRTLVWVSPTSGQVMTAIWLLKQGADNGFQMASDHGVVLPPGFREDRRLYVDADLITLGIPSPRAFSLVQLPPGKRFPIGGELARAASRSRYTQSHIEELAGLLNGAIRGDD